MGPDLPHSVHNLIVGIITAFYLDANKQSNEAVELDLVGLSGPLLPLLLEEVAVLVALTLPK